MGGGTGLIFGGTGFWIHKKTPFPEQKRGFWWWWTESNIPLKTAFWGLGGTFWGDYCSHLWTIHLLNNWRFNFSFEGYWVNPPKPTNPLLQTTPKRFERTHLLKFPFLVRFLKRRGRVKGVFPPDGIGWFVGDFCNFLRWSEPMNTLIPQ